MTKYISTLSAISLTGGVLTLLLLRELLFSLSERYLSSPSFGHSTSDPATADPRYPFFCGPNNKGLLGIPLLDAFTCYLMPMAKMLVLDNPFSRLLVSVTLASTFPLILFMLVESTRQGLPTPRPFFSTSAVRSPTCLSNFSHLENYTQIVLSTLLRHPVLFALPASLIGLGPACLLLFFPVFDLATRTLPEILTVSSSPAAPGRFRAYRGVSLSTMIFILLLMGSFVALTSYVFQSFLIRATSFGTLSSCPECTGCLGCSQCANCLSLASSLLNAPIAGPLLPLFFFFPLLFPLLRLFPVPHPEDLLPLTNARLTRMAYLFLGGLSFAWYMSSITQLAFFPEALSDALSSKTWQINSVNFLAVNFLGVWVTPLLILLSEGADLQEGAKYFIISVLCSPGAAAAWAFYEREDAITGLGDFFGYTKLKSY